MQKRSVQPGRPAGTTTRDAELAHAFGAAVPALRTERGIAQDSLAHLASVERSHMGKMELGEHMPTLALIFKISGALECSTAVLMSEAESQLAAAAKHSRRRTRPTQGGFGRRED
ncbi:helix-turn-helix domain-containing protein [Chitinasiproducens palmae]|uniref:helix-turn-helix domain-containing protein n=1 Tax=Chitinasiproducens palmae TaxID=1770053 RepID=UPI000A74CA00|nr:helix-turn-helix transcriptional regulator [Chitinasiproducens palmae]